MQLDLSQLVFRDADAADMQRCLALDSSYHSNYVWQMTVQEFPDDIHINCRRQRLPRAIDSQHKTDPRQLMLTLAPAHCFVVVQQRDSEDLLGFLTLRVDAISRLAYLQDLVIDRSFRRASLGSRLVNVARIWALEHDIRQIIFEIPTTNVPCILFAKAIGFTFCGFSDRHLASRDIAVFFALPI